MTTTKKVKNKRTTKKSFSNCWMRQVVKQSIQYCLKKIISMDDGMDVFSLLQVLFLLGKAGVPSNEAAPPPHGRDSPGKKSLRRSLRDTSQRFGRRSSHESAANRGSPRLSREESSPRGSLTSSLTPSPKCKAKSAPNSHQGSHSAKKQE